jgi:methylamine dehydrogenase heavy chain
MQHSRPVPPITRAAAVATALGVALLAGPAPAQLAVERTGRVETIALPYSPHWLVIGDIVQRRSALVDVDDGRLLGILDSGWGLPQTLHPSRGQEIYVTETHYSRGSRGERTDVLTVYDPHTLAPTGEIVIPSKRALSATPVAHAALSDDDRFAAIFNLTPATSLSIVDLERRRFVGEIATPGCSLVYPVGARRFALICMDGSLMVVTLDDEGREAAKLRTPTFFDPEEDPITEKAARWRDRWLFVSFEGRIHPVNFAGDQVVFEEPWSLTPDRQSEEGWRIGGAQHLAAHEATGRLYALMHQGGPHTHKTAGTEVWVYDLATRERIQRIDLESPGLTFLGTPIDGGPRWGWLVDWLANWMVDAVPELAIDGIAVTQDDAPLLVTTGLFSGGVAAYDALTGKFLRRVYSGNLTNVALQAPFRPPLEPR